MNTTILFGLALGPLYMAISQVESERSANVYQIRDIYIADVNRICEKLCKLSGTAFRPFPIEAKFDRRTSERMMAIYWQHWGMDYEKKTGERVTYEVLARIHNGGPLGWKKRETLRYWHLVLEVLSEELQEGGEK